MLTVLYRSTMHGQTVNINPFSHPSCIHFFRNFTYTVVMSDFLQLPNPNLEKTTDSKLPPQEPLPAVPSGRKTRKQPSTVSECHNGTALCVHTQPRPVVTTPTLIRSPSSQANHLEHPIDIECIQQDKDHSQEQALLTTEQRLPVSVQNTGNVVHQELTCLSVDEVCLCVMNTHA